MAVTFNNNILDYRSLAQTGHPGDVEASVGPSSDLDETGLAAPCTLNSTQTMSNQGLLGVVAKKLQVLTVVASLCILVASALHSFHSKSRSAPVEVIVTNALEQQQIPECQDTPGWSNNWVDCVNEYGGSRPELCTPRGWTCRAYEEKQWCVGGSGARFALGGILNSPEKHCCACGGGHHDLNLEAIGPFCHTSVEGEACFQSVQWIMKVGIYQHAEKFPGLNSSSPFQAFQHRLHMDNPKLCPEPCAQTPSKSECHTAVRGEECYAHVQWGIHHGIFDEPTWFPNLTGASSFEGFQRAIHTLSPHLCPKPCHGFRQFDQAACHTAREGEVCYKRVVWIRNKGINEHPEWYPSLQPSSPFEDFQSALVPQGQCPDPCRSSEACHTATRGEECFEQVYWLKLIGIHEHPDWYPTLHPSSSFEAFQQFLHTQNSTLCPIPCQTASCHTSVPGEHCFKVTSWVKDEGILTHPDWYTGLTPTSSFEEFQTYIHQQNTSLCPLPCGTLPAPTQLPAPLPIALTKTPLLPTKQALNCQTALYGEVCYHTLEWAIREGIHLQPELFPGLNPSSGLEEFQMLLHRTNTTKCPNPPCMIKYQSYSTPTFRVMPKTVIKGMAYGPSPLKKVGKLHNDDFMAWDAAPLWASWGRGDLRIMTSLGVNHVRTYGNDPRANKRMFLDEAYKAGIGINAGMSDWPFKQSPTRCMLLDYYCFNQTYHSYRGNLLNGLTINNYTAYHPALKVFTIMNEPELKIFPRTLVCRALITTFDAILQAEKDVGVTGNPVAFTVTFSFAKMSGPPALGQMMDLHDCIMNPQTEPTMYTPRNDVLDAYRTRFVNSFNTASPHFAVQKEFFDVYNRSGFWDHKLKMPVFIGEYHSVNFPLQKDFTSMQRTVSEYPFFMGVTFFEYQVRYDKGGSEKEFGMFRLGDCKLMDMHFLGEDYSVWDLMESYDHLSPSQEKMDGIVARVFGGNADVSRLGNPMCGALKEV